MKIYTRTGDNGTTGLFGEQQVSKDSLRVEAYGTIDALNAQLGLGLLAIEGRQWRERIVQVQNDLLVLGADLATPLGETTASAWVPRIAEVDVSRLESWSGQAEGELMPNRLSDFLFVWARLVNQRLGVAGQPWIAHGAPAGGC